jgi:hypothetical protein
MGTTNIQDMVRASHTVPLRKINILIQDIHIGFILLHAKTSFVAV